MADSIRATEKNWEEVTSWAKVGDFAPCLLELRDRVAALEAMARTTALVVPAAEPKWVVLPEDPPIPGKAAGLLSGMYLRGFRAGWSAARAEVERQQQGGQSDTASTRVWHWEVRDPEGRIQAVGLRSTVEEAMLIGRSHANQHTPCSLRVWTERTVHDEDWFQNEITLAFVASSTEETSNG